MLLKIVELFFAAIKAAPDLRNKTSFTDEIEFDSCIVFGDCL